MDRSQGVPAYPVVVGDDGNTPRGAIVDLHSKPRTSVGRAIRLPPVDEPPFHFQPLRWKDLDTHTIEKPWSVGGNIGWLIGPVVEVVETEKPDIGEKNSGVDVDAVQLVDVISGVRLGEITIGSVEIKLSP